MRLKAEQLKSHLQRGLSPVYLLSGDTQLLVQEACDLVRQHARQAGFTERLIMHVDRSFDWQEFLQTTHGLSLFAERRLIELRLPTARPGDFGSKILQEYAEHPVPDNILLVVTGKIDASTQRGKWFKALESAGVVVQVWPLDARQLPGWIMQRMREKGMQPSQDAVTVLAQRVEGNLLACVQEIERLHLLYGSTSFDAQAVVSSVADSSRFDIYTLVDCALGGDMARTTRIVHGLRSEGVETVLVLWALAREIRLLASMSHDINKGVPDERVLSRTGIWEKRKAAVRQGLRRHSLQGWHRMLRQAGYIDRIIKGMSAGNAWDELLDLSLLLAGAKTLSKV
jgi:DNA polymerase III subunit delta